MFVGVNHIACDMMFVLFQTGPPTVDFGNICLKSVSEKKLHIINNLDYYIHVVLQVGAHLVHM